MAVVFCGLNVIEDFVVALRNESVLLPMDSKLMTLVKKSIYVEMAYLDDDAVVVVGIGTGPSPGE